MQSIAMPMQGSHSYLYAVFLRCIEDYDYYCRYIIYLLRHMAWCMIGHRKDWRLLIRCKDIRQSLFARHPLCSFDDDIDHSCSGWWTTRKLEGEEKSFKINRVFFAASYREALPWKRLNKHIICVVTSMEQPLGKAVGHSLEVIESIETF